MTGVQTCALPICVVPDPETLPSKPTDVDAPPVLASTVAPVAPFAITAVAVIAALAETDVNRPKPIADTATSAMRLRSVFVDIIFLSLVRSGLS